MEETYYGSIKRIFRYIFATKYNIVRIFIFYDHANVLFVFLQRAASLITRFSSRGRIFTVCADNVRIVFSYFFLIFFSEFTSEHFIAAGSFASRGTKSAYTII